MTCIACMAWHVMPSGSHQCVMFCFLSRFVILSFVKSVKVLVDMISSPIHLQEERFPAPELGVECCVDWSWKCSWTPPTAFWRKQMWSHHIGLAQIKNYSCCQALFRSEMTSDSVFLGKPNVHSAFPWVANKTQCMASPKMECKDGCIWQLSWLIISYKLY